MSASPRPTKPAAPKNIIQKVGGVIGGAVRGAVKGADDYVVGKGPNGTTTVDMPPVSLFTGIAGAARGAYLGAQGRYAAPKGSADYQPKRVSAPTDKARNPNRVTGSGPAMSNPANTNSGYTSFMQPGNSPDNYRTSYGSDFMGRNMVTAPKPGGPILKITEGGNSAYLQGLNK